MRGGHYEKTVEYPARQPGLHRRGKYAKKRARQGQGGRLLLACVTLCNVGLSLALAVLRRQEVLHAVRTQDGEGVQVLLTAQKETKTQEEREVSP